SARTPSHAPTRPSRTFAGTTKSAEACDVLRRTRSSHAETKQFCKQKRRYGAKPIAGGDETQPDEFHRQHDDKRDDKHNQRRIGRQIFNPPGNCNLELAPGNEIDDTRDYGLEVIP